MLMLGSPTNARLEQKYVGSNSEAIGISALFVPVPGRSHSTGRSKASPHGSGLDTSAMDIPIMNSRRRLLLQSELQVHIGSESVNDEFRFG